MKLVEKFSYAKLTREDGGPGGRVYLDPNGNKLPSVTTILDATKPEESKKALDAWRRRIGQKKAHEITTEAAFRGTMMHSFLERYLKGETPVCGSNFYHQHSFKMAGIILETYLKPFLNETWGIETTLYYPELYAGTCDVYGMYKGISSIIDFKQSNKLKTDERVEDYKVQMSAYALAHDIIHGTTTEQAVILMCTKDFVPQTWIMSGAEFDKYKNIWWNRVSDYYKI